MRVLDEELNKLISDSEKNKNWYLCLALLELKQLRVEKRFNNMIVDDPIHKKYVETKVKL
jgi:hypothetical protein